MSGSNPKFYETDGLTMFPISPSEQHSPAPSPSPPDQNSEADDEIAAPSLALTLYEVSSGNGSRRSTPRRITPPSRTTSPRSLTFDMPSYFLRFRFACVDVTDDARSIAIAAAKLECLYHFAPDYFTTGAEGCAFSELRHEYAAYRASISPSNAVRIGQLTEKLRHMLSK